MEGNLKKNTIKGFKWTALNTLFNALSAPIYQIFLALLLIPEEFAYIAVISLVIGLSILMSNVGIGEAVIQKDKINSKQISTLIYLNGIITIIIAGLFYLGAPYIEKFYKLQNMQTILRLLVITIVFNGISSIFRVYLQRNILFKEYSLAQIVKTITDIIISVILILLGFGIMGYVYGTIVSTILYAFLLIIFTFKKTDIKILFHFNIKEAIPFINFGLSISLKKILTFFSQRMDEVIIGGILTPEILGIYYFGKRLILQLQSVITNSFSQVLFPVFSKMKNNLIRLKNAYMTVSYGAAMIGFPIFVGITVTAHLVIPLAFGERWIEAVDVVRILSLVMIFQVLTANIATSILYSINKPNLVLFIDIVTVVIYFISLFLLSNGGLYIIITLYSMYTIIKATILQFSVSREVKFKFTYYILQFKNVIISTVLMAIIVLFIQNYILFSFPELIQLISSILTGILIYVGMQYLIDQRNLKVFIFTFFRNR